MSKILTIAALFGAAIMIQGCIADRPNGIIFTDASYDALANGGDISGLKLGTSVAESYFGLVGIGDCSINSAAKNGGITDIKIVDKSCYTVFGYSKITTKVYGTTEQQQKKKDEADKRQE